MDLTEFLCWIQLVFEKDEYLCKHLFYFTTMHFQTVVIGL